MSKLKISLYRRNVSGLNVYVLEKGTNTKANSVYSSIIEACNAFKIACEEDEKTGNATLDL